MGHRNGPSSDEHRAEFSSPSPQVQPDTRLAYLGTLQLSEVARWGFSLTLPYLVWDLAVQRRDVTMEKWKKRIRALRTEKH